MLKKWFCNWSAMVSKLKLLACLLLKERIHVPNLLKFPIIMLWENSLNKCLFIYVHRRSVFLQERHMVMIAGELQVML